MRVGLAFVVMCFAGCSSSAATPDEQQNLPPRIRDAGDTSSGDAAADGGKTTVFPVNDDASTTVGDCDVSKPFGTPQLILDPNIKSATPRLSHDELTIYFTSDDGTNPTDLYRAKRASRSAAFGQAEVMTIQSSPSNDNDPAPSADHLSVFFHSGRSGNNELYVATRATAGDEFGMPMLVPNVNDATVPDAHPYYRSAGGGELFLTSLRGGATTYHIHHAKKNVAGFVTPTAVVELGGAWNDYQPMVTEDGLTMLFASDRPTAGTATRLWLANRSSDTDAWGTPQKIDELESTGAEFAGWLSADRCRIYFSSSRDSAMHRVYFAARPL